MKDGEEEDEDIESQKESEKVDEDFIKLQEDMAKNLPLKKTISSWVVTGLDDEYGLILSPESLFEKHCILYKKEDIHYIEKTYKNKTLLENAIQDTTKVFKRKGANKKIYHDFSKISKLRQRKVVDYNLFCSQE